MVTLTTLIAVFGSFATFFSNPLRSLLIYFAVMLWYPQYLTLDFGTISFTTSRILILAVLSNVLFRTKLVSEFKWTKLDFFVLAAFLGKCIALTTTTELALIVERQGGLLFDTVFLYFAVRLIVTSRKDLVSFTKALVFIAVPLAFVGVYDWV